VQVPRCGTGLAPPSLSSLSPHAGAVPSAVCFPCSASNPTVTPGPAPGPLDLASARMSRGPGCEQRRRCVRCLQPQASPEQECAPLLCDGLAPCAHLCGVKGVHGVLALAKALVRFSTCVTPTSHVPTHCTRDLPGSVAPAANALYGLRRLCCLGGETCEAVPACVALRFLKPSGHGWCWGGFRGLAPGVCMSPCHLSRSTRLARGME
jgi:hypothetical protein